MKPADQRRRMTFAPFLLAATVLGNLTACDKKPPAEPVTPAATTVATSRDTPPDPPSGLMRQPLRPVADYVSFQVGTDSAPIAGLPDEADTMRSMYWAAAPRDDALLAYDFLPAYRKETDTFKREDLIKGNKAQLDAAFAASRAKTHFALESVKDSNVTVGRYDPQEKGFEVRLSYNDGEVYGLLKPNESRSTPQPEWALLVLGTGTDMNENGKKVFYHPKTEAEARAIEGKLATSANGATGSIYVPATRLGHMVASYAKVGFTQNNPTAVFVMDGVVLRIGPAREALFTIDSAQLGQSVEVKAEKVRTLMGMPVVAKFDHRRL